MYVCCVSGYVSNKGILHVSNMCSVAIRDFLAPHTGEEHMHMHPYMMFRQYILKQLGVKLWQRVCKVTVKQRL